MAKRTPHGEDCHADAARPTGEAANDKAVSEAKLSEDELAIFEAALSYVLRVLSEDEIERRFGASVDEIEGVRDDLRAISDKYGETAATPEPLAKTS